MVQDMQSHKSKASTDVAVKVKVDAKLKTAESCSIWKDPGEKELRKYGKENKTELYFERVGVCWKAKLSIFSFMFPKFSYKGLGASKTVQQAQFSASLAATSEFWKKEWLSLQKKPDTLQIFYQRDFQTKIPVPMNICWEPVPAKNIFSILSIFFLNEKQPQLSFAAASNLSEI